MTKGTTLTAQRTNTRGPFLEGTTVVVLGFRRSGRAAAALLQEVGAKVRVSDSSPLDDLGLSAADVPGGVAWLGGADPGVLQGADLVVVSPGVPPANPLLRAALDRGIPVRSELELGWWFTDAPTVAITGTNGKTTTTELLGAMGRAAGRSTLVAGNVGTPLSSAVDAPPELIVLEVSSFQLFLCEDFRPHVGAILNLTTDHLDWHPDFEHYAAAKRKLFERQEPQDAAVLNLVDPEVTARFRDLPGEVFGFRESPAPDRGAFIRDERLTLRLDGDPEPVLALSEWSLPGRHNRENLLAAALCARLIGLDDDAIRNGARSFRGLPHRMEIVEHASGVHWINDSKSTNPGSLEKALDPDLDTLLIAGGVTKGCDFRAIRDAVERGTTEVLLIGEGAAEMAAAWRSATRTEIVGDLGTAVRVAHERVRPGQRVLFSPGCASFDQFDNYVHRGDTFRELVRRIHRKDSLSSKGGDA
ncbi:MAG: UDP-N-acetylmuramoylalanine--D-glutamate ligase [Gemmatimonadota bacterium]|nr:MAG: UDP-N-acetylmuramoylalanine--D-glutamate ligase [Gemmatimonadota bacterium]